MKAKGFIAALTLLATGAAHASGGGHGGCHHNCGDTTTTTNNYYEEKFKIPVGAIAFGLLAAGTGVYCGIQRFYYNDPCIGKPAPKTSAVDDTITPTNGTSKPLYYEMEIKR